MGLLTGYGSDDSSSEKSGQPARKRRVIRLDYAKLPISRPLPPIGVTETKQEQESRSPSDGEQEESGSGIQSSEDEADNEKEEAEVADAEDNMSSVLAPTTLAHFLPAPRQAVPANLQSQSQVEIDYSVVGKPTEKPKSVGANAWIIRPRKNVPEVEESQEELPASLLKHPMLRTLQSGPAGPSQADVEHLKSESAKVIHIRADSMKDPDWKLNNLVSGQPGLLRASRVPSEISQYDQERWQSTTLSNPSKTQKRKHHINWLAHEAIEKEAEDLDRAAGGKLTKAQTRSRYGW